MNTMFKVPMSYKNKEQSILHISVMNCLITCRHLPGYETF